MALLMASALRASAQTAQRPRLSGHQPAAVAGQPPQGQLDASTRLKLSISLPLHNPEALTNLLAQIYDPANPSYRHYLTPEEFDARFGPTEADYQAVIAFAMNSGFTVTAQHPNRMLLEVSAAVADVERALQVTLRTYTHPTESRTFFAPDVEPAFGPGVPILHIAGLDNFARPHPKNLRPRPVKMPANITPKGGSGPNGTLSGFDYRAVYAPGVSLTGTGQMIGLVEFDGYYASDITTYESLTGLPNVPLQIVLLNGFNGVPTPGAYSGNTEVAMDIEMAISMAPGLSKVVVYEADPTNGLANDILQAMSTNTLIKQFSCSWSFGPVTPAQRTAMDNYFLKFAAQGQSFFDAAGDTGAFTGVVGAPDDDPYITQVGGTTLATAGPGGAWLSETVWNSQFGPGVGGSSGGVSSIYPIPAWQQGVGMSANSGSTAWRNSPDVAMVADNVFIVADNGHWEISGGTSAGAPLWAGFTALANQQAVAAGLPTVGFLNPALYHLATNSGSSGCFDDVTLGNNTNYDTLHYFAVPGYDLCTGWGSPSGGSLIIALVQPDGFQITPGRGLVANGPVGGPFTVSTQSLSVTNTGKPAFNWSLGNPSSWLNISSSSGTLTAGGGATAVTLALNAAANLLPAGGYSANVWFTNLTSGLAQLRQFILQVGQEMVQDGGFEAGDFCYWNLSGGLAAYTNNYVDDGTYTYYSAVGGIYLAAFGQVSTLAYLSQPLPTRAGQIYLLSLWLENPYSPTLNQFVVQWNTNAASANTIFNQANLGVFGWSNLQFVVTAASSLTTLQFGFRNDHDYFAVDNVSVIPVPAPVLQPPALAGGALHLAWTALPGVRYQVQYKTNLAQANWINLGGSNPATTNPMTLTDPLATDPRRFYRVTLVP